jgi:polysaccharide biosynthesis/export protein
MSKSTAVTCPQTSFDRHGGLLRRLAVATLGLALAMAITGCQTVHYGEPSEDTPSPSEAITLRPGDTLKVAFPGAPNLDNTQQIRQDGKIVLSLVGEIQAAGKTLSDLQKEIIKLYSSQLVSKEVTVTVLSASYPVFVTGAVLRPGKIITDRPLTALEAVMEAGGFDPAKADPSAVVVIRHEKDQVKNFKLNLKLALQGKPSAPFYLKPSDIVSVPERFSWF